MSTPPMDPTTEQIQKYLEENRKLIAAIMNNRSQGNSLICAMYLDRLQSNLTYLARVADNQPQSSRMASEGVAEEKAMHAAAASQNTTSCQQPPGFTAPNLPFQMTDQQLQLVLSLQQQELIQTQLGLGLFSPQPSQTGPGNNFQNVRGNRQDADAGDRFGKGAS